MHTRSMFRAGVLAGSLACGACALAPTDGPATSDIVAEQQSRARIKVVDLTPDAVGRMRVRDTRRTFADHFTPARPRSDVLGRGDIVAITIWEAPPATLFGSVDTTGSMAPAAAKATALPEQTIDSNGRLIVPFAGSIGAAGMTVPELESTIVSRLKSKANEPQVLVRIVRNATADVTVVGDVGSSMRVPLTPKGERLLDALAAAGGVRQPVNKVTVQITRGTQVFSMPLDAVIRDPRQNIALQAGDVVTALYQPVSFMAFGATGKNEEIGFEGQGISLAQALARSGGLLDSRADARGVFVFRLEDVAALAVPRDETMPVTADGRVPVVYRIDMKDPASMFIAQQFPMHDKDMLYVSNAPVADIQKLANLFYTVVFPAVSVGTQFR
ncbi:polysaccharide biosynthesis/export family protein [Burkholderia sp. BE17]|uniref:polysaccharide biosynthesis/export family protein n=1 Tax=Burkholderia sp. BE17 TaxID=2656644 RepID=UPI001D121CFE|nr:polysaccharide biosynthesis/export family protein [Burkholderia sp. BE17]